MIYKKNRKDQPFCAIKLGKGAYIHRLNISIMDNIPHRKELWARLLKNWVKVMEEYMTAATDGNEKDVPYWHGEDANTSFLAAAAWKSGAIAIEQFDVERRYEQKRKPSKGHCDLWVKFKGKDGFDFTVEAKKSWSPTFDDVEEKLKYAKKQLTSIVPKRERGTYLISLCFATPECSSLANRIDYRRSFLQKFDNDQRKHLIIASYFPKRDKKDLEWKGKYYLGVILVGRISKQGDK